MVDSSFAGEIMKRAKMLIMTKGEDALEHANEVFEGMRKTSNEEDCVYWHRIVQQVEILVAENGPG